MDERLIRKIAEYAQQFDRELGQRLGYGIHGVVFCARRNAGAGPEVDPRSGHRTYSAIKALAHWEPYERERDAYLRLRDAGVGEIRGFQVPKLIGFSDNLRVVEMTVVSRPYVLDFAGAYLDSPPEFSPEIWDEWEAEKVDQYGARWLEVKAVLGDLEEIGVFMMDVSPNNVALNS